MRLNVKTDDGAIDRVVTVKPSSQNLAELLGTVGITLNRRCGGDGNCGGCNLVIEKGDFEVRGKVLAATPERHRNVLACQTRVTGDTELRIPSRSRLDVCGVIETGFHVETNGRTSSVRNVTVRVPAASLSDHRSDAERLTDALTGLIGEPSYLPHALTGRMPNLGINPEVTATLTRQPDGWRIAKLTTGEAAPLFGIAIDIGTTTVAGLLVDLENDTILFRSSRYNQQIVLADDVASRISIAGSQDMIDSLRDLVVRETICPVIDSLCHSQGLMRKDIGRVAIAGNTVMSHLLLGLSVEGIGRAPFAPVVRAPQDLRAGDLGLQFDPDMPVDILPAISGYVGGDITADILATGLLAREHGTVLIDLGTNCEMVLRDDDGLVACSTPAGPAFEGGGLSHGMRATDGAISHIRIADNYQFELESFGCCRPRGLCGSAIIDFIAEAFRTGLVSRSGRFDTEKLQKLGRLARAPNGRKSMAACILVRADASGTDGAIWITEKDISEILQAKSAVHAGLKSLLYHRGRNIDQIPELILTGGFARHVNLDNAMTLGLIPRIPVERVTVFGNGALAGAYLSLVDHTALATMQALHRMPEVIELNLIPEFEGNFIDGLFLPHPPQGQNQDRFQSTHDLAIPA
jgi:uncharacterized 2Fe-2S/4Fe-4S cluster protein (DUF4445 family)